MLRPLRFAGRCGQSMSSGFKLIKSRASGLASVAIINEASRALRVIGPATRPM